jgi:hypothetical protein
MFQWLGENIGTIIVLALMAAAVAGVIASMVKRKKSGGSSCSCGCSSCAMSGSCHGDAKSSESK